ncbi:MAG: hypothetical protein HOL51_16120 [Gemmatimonadetes bacterium]|nr:hypothetical protein [Gemmatimonadota bacterium]MBT5327639.1 hypothetical protein [Gemmatimonadota bacterium]MBT5451198.1 hypothetical protein [Gemmatimonadota bacterium]MBT5802899.1 hypothetical protein [Gemmatimonadota bacterium]MBT6623116.1 hypothetical protein [Gemmatimonadota bacterium]
MQLLTPAEAGRRLRQRARVSNSVDRSARSSPTPYEDKNNPLGDVLRIDQRFDNPHI